MRLIESFRIMEEHLKGCLLGHDCKASKAAYLARTVAWLRLVKRLFLAYKTIAAILTPDIQTTFPLRALKNFSLNAYRSFLNFSNGQTYKI